MNSYNLYEYDTNSDTEDSLIYSSEEHNINKYSIALCYFKKIRNVIYNIVHIRFKKNDIEYINTELNLMGHLKLDIVEHIYLPLGYCIAISKTFWIRIIQRVWKKIFKKRKTTIQNIKNIYNLKYRETNGSFPKGCINYPQIKGMLYTQIINHN